MRRGLVQLQHLMTTRKQMRRQSRRDPANAGLREQLDALTDRILDLIAEEMVFQHRDIANATVAARRRPF